MNLRQKKKKYKKEHGYNPLKDQDGKMILDDKEIYKAMATPENMAKFMQTLKPFISDFNNIFEKFIKRVFEAIGDAAYQIGLSFEKATERISCDEEEKKNIVIVSEVLTERR